MRNAPSLGTSDALEATDGPAPLEANVGLELDGSHNVRFASLMHRHLLLVLGAVACCPALALAWTSGSPFSATVHNHTFSRVDAESDECSIKAKLQFTAPAEQYREPNAVRNYYRFKARLRFASGKQAASPIFFSKKPGNHSFSFSADTTAEGCWSKNEQKIIGVDVEGCRGQGCTVRAFTD